MSNRTLRVNELIQRELSAILRQELGRRIVLKFMPRFEYLLDHSAERGTHLLKLLDEVAPPANET
jgi:ribosome-binding factor A